MRLTRIYHHHHLLNATVRYQLGASKAHRGGDVYSAASDFGEIRSRDGVLLGVAGRAVPVVRTEIGVAGSSPRTPVETRTLGLRAERRPVVRRHEPLSIARCDDDRPHLVTVTFGPLTDDAGGVHPHFVPIRTRTRSTDDSDSFVH